MANLNLSQFTEKLFVADADHTFIWDTVGAISKRVSRNSWLSGTTANCRLGLADAAAPVAQTLSVQSVVAGTTNTAGAAFTIDGSQGTGTGAGGALVFRTAAAGTSGSTVNALGTRMAITSAGNVGIGTTAPSTLLHIHKDQNTDTELRVQNSSDTSSATATINLVGSQGSTLVLRSNASTSAAPDASRALIKSTSNVFGINLKAESTVGTLQFYTGGGAAANERLRITAAGNVGIGTTSPTSKLHVAGNSSPSITVDNTLATGVSQLLFKNTVVTGDTDGVFLNGSTQTGFGDAGSLNIKATTGPIAFHTATITNALSIAQNGVATFGISVVVNSAVRTGFINNLGDSLSMFSFVNDSTGTSTYALGGSAPLMRFGGTTTSFPAIKRSTVRIQAVLANDSGFTNIQGKLTTDTDYTAGTIVPTGFLTLYDAQGTAYRVPCVV